MVFRVVSLISLPIAILGYTVSPFFISKLFPQYVSGIESMQLLVLFLTATMPLQLLSTFMIATKVSYRPFLIIGSLSAIEVISMSYLLIPKLGILEGRNSSGSERLTYIRPLLSLLYQTENIPSGQEGNLYFAINCALLPLPAQLGSYANCSTPRLQALGNSKSE